jgi:cysteinyl-tRNA synthetase
VTIDDFLREHGPDALRFMILNVSYRSPLTFTDEVVEQSERGLERLRGALRPAPGAGADAAAAATLRAAAAEARARFEAAMDDDFNSAGALGHLFDLVRRSTPRATPGRRRGAGCRAGDAEPLVGVLGCSSRRSAGGAGRGAAPFIELLIEITASCARQAVGAGGSIRDRLERGIALGTTCRADPAAA